MITIRKMEDTLSDYNHMYEWFLDTDLRKWVWCNTPDETTIELSQVIEKYRIRILNDVGVYPYFILLDGEPIGYIQYCFYAYSIGIDIWIGSSLYRNKGYGVSAINAMFELLRESYASNTIITIDPDPLNKRAIHCYEKAGFIYDHLEVDNCGNHYVMKRSLG